MKIKGSMWKRPHGSVDFAREGIWSILWKTAPPVMFAQLVQALYNIIDSLFIGSYSRAGLTALSILYPVQLLMIALAVGTGVGINTAMAAGLGAGRKEESAEYAGMGAPLALGLWGVFAFVCWTGMPWYASISTDSPDVAADVVRYGRIACLFSPGLFLESMWTKVLQAEGKMKVPMLAQIAGAAVNIALDPLLIFGMAGFPETGMEGAAAATVIGQSVAALVVARGGCRRPPRPRRFCDLATGIFALGVPNMVMQCAYTWYIFGLNFILSFFSDQAVTALGLYYKWMTFFFIPLGAMQTCIVPVVSFNHAAGRIGRCSETLRDAVLFGTAFMAVGTACFVLAPGPMLKAFTDDETVISIGRIAFPFIGASFVPMVTSLVFPVFFQAVGAGLTSSLLTFFRTLVLFVPLGFLFSRFGLEHFWMTFPTTEILSSLLGFLLCARYLRSENRREAGRAEGAA